MRGERGLAQGALLRQLERVLETHDACEALRGEADVLEEPPLELTLAEADFLRERRNRDISARSFDHAHGAIHARVDRAHARARVEQRACDEPHTLSVIACIE